MSFKTILITGANGFVGSNLYDYLSADYHLIGLDISGKSKYPPGDIYGWDELDSLPPADAIIHLAGKAHDIANITREEEYFEINLGLTKKIFDYFLRSNAQKFIFFSSVKAVADTVKGEWLSEDDEPDPQTPYGKSKLAAERYIFMRLSDLETEGQRDGERERGSETARKRNSEGAMNGEDKNGLLKKMVYILRPAMIHGSGNKGNLSLLYKVVRKGIPWPLGSFENQRSFTSMDNLSFVIRKFIESDIAPGIYQVADDEPVSTNRIIELMASSLRRKSIIWHLPKGMIRAIAKIGGFTKLPLNSERLKKLTESYRVSNARIKAALGIENMPVTAYEGLMKTFLSFHS